MTSDVQIENPFALRASLQAEKFNKTDVENPFENRLSNIKKRSGAPASVRAIVGSRQTPEDRIAEIRKFYPDARSIDKKATNFIFTDEDGKMNVYNPEGLDKRDFASIIPELGEVVGGVAGAVKGGPIGAGLGAAVGREGSIEAITKLTGAQESRTGKQRAIDFGTTFTVNAVLDAIIPVAGPVVRQGIRGVIAPKTAKETVDAAKNIGVDLTAGEIMGGEAIPAAEKLISQFPVQGAALRKRAEESAVALQGAINNLADEATKLRSIKGKPSGTMLTTGDIFQDGVRTGKRRIRDARDRIYNQNVWSKIDSSAPLEANKSSVLLNDLVEEFASNPEAAKLAGADDLKILQKAIDGDLTLEQAKKFKRVIWNLAEKTGKERPDIAGKISRVYKAFDDDIKDTIVKINPELTGAMNKSDALAAKLYEMESAIDPFVKNNPAAEKALSVFIDTTSIGRSANAQTLLQLKKAMPAQNFNEVARFHLMNMGLASPAKQGAERVFSPKQFVTNWKKMSPEARNTLFKETLGEDGYKALEKIVDVSDIVARGPIDVTGAGGGLGELTTATMLVGGGAVYSNPGLAFAAFIPGLFTATTTSKTMAKAVNKIPRDVLANPTLTRNRAIILGQMAASGVNDEDLVFMDNIINSLSKEQQ